ncbi:protein ROH1-like [Oryza brachyantha]|uniref:protein ROH1-like n=1 Tax=Oryza brachyantha TaxID=4533 RepID=UPI001ADD31F6|nr:protein ROH1-like [Oryza brachyantha]
MPVTEHQGSSSSPSPFSFGRSLLSLRRDHAAMPSGEEADLEAFQRHVAASLGELLPGEGEGGGGSGGGGAGGEEILSVAWIRRLLEAFILCQEEFRVFVAQARRRGGALPAAGEKLVVEFHERAVKALDVCNAARDGVDQVRRWERLADIAASVLLAPGEIHEGQLRRSRKALSDLAVLLVDDTTASGSGGVASFLASHRNRSFGRARASPSRSASALAGASSATSASHFRSLSWSVSRAWSASRQLQAIGAGLAAPRAHEAGLAAPVYAMGCVLHLAAWALVAAVPCPDRSAALQAHHLPAAPPRAAFPWAAPLLTLQERLAEEGKRKDRRNSCGLLKEIHVLEKSTQKLAEAIDAAPIPLFGDREADVREAAAELAAVCAAMRDGLEPLERQVREVFHRIVRSRVEGLDSSMHNAD